MSNTATLSPATGIALQLESSYLGQSRVISNGSSIDLGQTMITQNINISLSVKYYQTLPNVTAGAVQARATLNFTYD